MNFFEPENKIHVLTRYYDGTNYEPIISFDIERANAYFKRLVVEEVLKDKDTYDIIISAGFSMNTTRENISAIFDCLMVKQKEFGIQMKTHEKGFLKKAFFENKNILLEAFVYTQSISLYNGHGD